MDRGGQLAGGHVSAQEGGGLKLLFFFFSSLWAEPGVWVILCHHG